MSVVIQLENVGKQYRLGLVGTNTLRGDVTRWWYRMRGKEDPTLKIGAENRLDTMDGEYVWALRDINLEVKQGEILGVIGKNGAGKSTLLKLLSRVTGPTTGQINVKGRIASLLEVGTGFHPELTGRENIFINGAILGMTKREIQSKLDEIVDFAGVAKYLETPVKRYSSGMYVRLAFSVAAHLEPEILIVDEVLAVGDADFRTKATGKMKEVSEGQGRTVLFVSHNMDAIKNICTRSILLNNGKVILKGQPEEVIGRYLQSSYESEKKAYEGKIEQNGFVVSRAEVSSLSRLLSNGYELNISVDFSTPDDRPVSLILNVFREHQLAFAATTFHSDRPIDKRGKYRARFKIPPYLLNPGTHAFDFSIVDDTGNQHQYLYAKELLHSTIHDDGERRGKKYNKNWGGAVSPILDIDVQSIGL